MDHKHSNNLDTDSFVDDRMARLDPAPEWKPDAGRALEQLNQRKPSPNSQWMRVGMTATILAATVFVLALLPWQRFWTPKPVAMTAASTQTAPEQKPVEVQETPAATQPAQAFPQAPAAPTPEARGVETQAASQTGDTNPAVVRNVLPEYSEEGKKERIKGTVILRVTVRVDGTVQFESFQKTLGYGLDEKAREALEQWLFTPATRNGVAVANTVDVSVNFDLK
jgi:TonB family protein